VLVLAGANCYSQLPFPTRPNVSGKAVVWGRTWEGQTNIPTNAQSGVCAVAGHYGLSVALKTNGTIVVWGSNSVIPTGIGTYPFSTITNAAKVGVFSGSLGLLSTDGKLATMADGYEGPMLTISNVVDFSMGLGFRIVLKSDSRVEVYGNNTYGSNKLAIPSGALTNVKAVAAGTYHAGVIDKNGKVIIWGPDWPTGSNPLNVPVGAQTNVASLSIGWGHAVALKNDGSIIAWGYNDYGQLSVPQEAQSNNVVGVVADESHSAALLNDGRIIVWGYNGYGQKSVPSGVSFVGISGVGQAVYAVQTLGWLLTTSSSDLQKGTVSSGGYKEIESVQSVQATPNQGYIFTGWSGDSASTNNPLVLVMNTDKAVTANFAPDNGDTDEDGLSNYQEVIIFNTNPNQPETNSPVAGLYLASQYQSNWTNGRTAVLNAPNSYGLFNSNQMLDLKFGGMVVGKTNNQLVLTYQINQSTNLTNWTSYREESLVITNAPADKMFLRLNPKQ